MPRVYESAQVTVFCDEDRERFNLKHEGDPVTYKVELRFGRGPNGDLGFNGVTEEALLAVVLERLVGLPRAAEAANPETAMEHLRLAVQHVSAGMEELAALQRAILLPPPKLVVVEPFHKEEVSAELPRDLASATKPVEPFREETFSSTTELADAMQQQLDSIVDAEEPTTDDEQEQE